MNKQFVNEDIYARKVILIDANGLRVGEVFRTEAIRQAQEQGLDLVQIQANDQGPPLCKILDYGKMKYEQSKQKTQKSPKEKEIFFHLGTSTHDLATKTEHAKELLSKGHKVKLGIEMRRRECQFSNNAKEKLASTVAEFASVARWDDIHSAGRFVFVNLQPLQR